jgi:hypothetical protein
MSRLEVPFLVIHGGEDVVTSPEYSQRLYDSAAARDKKVIIYEGPVCCPGARGPLLSPYRLECPCLRSDPLTHFSLIHAGAHHADLFHGGPMVKDLIGKVMNDVGGWLRDRS